ncbi:hypothetical protein C8Q78DRAFT_1079774 [Trametes maxima]|nr:hypothetical protein C8Q78DRAFT_1079774 [Trametes maxima]
MWADSLTSAVIGLELCNILLLSLLLATPAPKHSMVKSLMVACLLRSILDVLPPIVDKSRPGDFQPEVLNQQIALASFCVSASVLLRYITVAKAAFAVSFTLPALWLAVIQIRPKRSADDYPRLTRRMVLLLCVAPFVWALPVLLVPIPPLVQGRIVWAKFYINSCYFDDNLFAIVSLVFTLVPLGLAVLISCAVVFVISRWSNTVICQRASLCSRRSARFAALVFVTVISASLYAVVLVKWLKEHSAWDQTTARPLRLLVGTSVIWEAITPLLFFVIFAAQDEIYETWLGWISRFVPLPRGLRDGRTEDSPAPQYVTYGSYISPPNQPIYSKVPHDADISPGGVHPVYPGKIIARPLSARFIHRSSYSDRRHHAPTLSVPVVEGLSPPPRPQFSRQPTTDEASRASRFRFPFVHSPSLTAFGSQPSMLSQLNSSSAGELSGEEIGLPTATVASHERVPWEVPRSDTPISTTTFGRTAVPRR